MEPGSIFVATFRPADGEVSGFYGELTSQVGADDFVSAAKKAEELSLLLEPINFTLAELSYLG